MSSVTVERVPFEAIDRVRDIWLALREHHTGLEPDRPAQPPDRSWELRRAVYAKVLRDPRSFALVAARAGRDIGYAVVAVHDGPDDTWITGDAIAEVETLSVMASCRGEGVGTALLDRVDAELAEVGVADLQIAVTAANVNALRFYERRGLTQRLVVLSRFS